MKPHRFTPAELGQLWTGRIKAAGEVYERCLPDWRLLEDALAGVYGNVMPPTALSDGKGGSVMSNGEQITLNLLLRISTYMTGLCFDEQPSVAFSRAPGEDADSIVCVEKAGEMLLDDGEAMREARRAIRYMMTRGSFIMWLYVNRASAPTEEVIQSRMDPAQWVVQARAGQLTELPDRGDFYAVAEAARAVLADPVARFGMTPEEQQRVAALLEASEIAHARFLNGIHASQTEARIMFQAAPYGSWTRWDPTVTDFRRASWAAHKIVLDYEEFLDSPEFSDEAKDKIAPGGLHMTGDPAFAHLSTMGRDQNAIHGPQKQDAALEDTGRVPIWVCYDRQRWKRYYIAEGYSEPVGKDDRYPYLSKEGKPLFSDFYPCVVRTPIQHNREKPEQALGIPFLAPPYPQQVELNRTRTAYYRSCQKAGRTFVSGQALDSATKNALLSGQDPTIVEAPPGYDRTKQGDLLTQIDWGQVPIEYLMASQHLKADLAMAGSMSLAALTGEPVADTLGQEEIALKGATATQSDVVRELESAIGDLTKKALILLQNFGSDAEILSYLGKDKAGMVPVFRSMDIKGRKMTCRFASTVRSEELAKIKQHMDMIALAAGPAGRDATMMPYFDVRSLFIGLSKKMDVQLDEYKPSEAELIAAALTKAMATQAGQGMNSGPGGGDNKAPGGGDKTGRKAGGERGAPAIPNAQSRGRAPQTSQQMTGAAMRPMTAV